MHRATIKERPYGTHLFPSGVETAHYETARAPSQPRERPVAGYVGVLDERIEYVGLTPYDKLPSVMAGFDVALMPFALNDATRSIRPTKTLEYLAAGLSVVSTRVPDVVTDYSEVVHLAGDGADFAAACWEVLEHSRPERDRRVRPIQQRPEVGSHRDRHVRIAGGVRRGGGGVRNLRGWSERMNHTRVAPLARTVGAACPTCRRAAPYATAEALRP